MNEGAAALIRKRSARRDMGDTITYTVEVDGDQYEHEQFLSLVADFNGAEVTAQRD